MTDKQKIFEILRNYTKKHNISASSVILEEYADELLANGVILPPCKVGDTVYIPVSNTILHTKVFAFGVDEDGNKVINPKEYPEGVFGVVGCEIGKTVFLTKEDAEEKLKELGK